MKKTFVFLLVGLFIGVMLVGFLFFRGKKESIDPDNINELTSLNVSYAVSPVYALDLISLDGKTVNLADYLGKPLVINFWASWCPPCKDELSLLQTTYSENRADVEFIGINMAESESAARDVVDGFGLSYLILMDGESKAAETLFIQALPTTLFFDAEGQLLSRHIGLLDKSLLENYLVKIGLDK